MEMAIDLSLLPPPAVVEELSFEVTLDRMKAELVSRFPSVAPVLQLESSLLNKLLQVVAYRETNLRARINDAARANLLAFAKGSDLDHLATFYELVRMYGESDERFAERLILAIQGRSTGGTEPRYKFIAMSADIRVQDVSIYTIGRSPVIHAAVFSSDNNGVADQILIDKVHAALNDPSVRMVNDTIVTAPAASTLQTVVVNVWLLPSAPLSTIASMEATLRTAWNAEMHLGRDISRSWLISKLMIGGVQRVEIVTPAADIVVPFNEAAALGTVTIINKGRDF
jgi:phage-related baseplate assembly protein